jgi:isocitrate dehydrogenase (NAD+)
MMLRHLGQDRPAARIEKAATRLLQEGKVLTRDLGGRATTTQVTERLVALL